MRNLRIAPVLLVALAALSLLVAFDSRIDAGKVHSGVSVGEVSLGGKTPEEARALLEERSQEITGVDLEGDGETTTIDARRLGLDFDVNGTVDKAYGVGREGGLVSRVFGRLGRDVEPQISYDPAVMRASVAELAEDVNEEARSATVGVRGGKISVEKARVGYRLDQRATTANIEEAVTNLTGRASLVGREIEPEIHDGQAERAAKEAREAVSGPITLSYEDREWEIPAGSLTNDLTFDPNDGEITIGLDRDRLREDMKAVYDELADAPVEAKYRINGTDVSVVPGRVGQRVEDEKLFDEMSSGVFEGERNYTVSVAEARPKLTTAEARRMKPTTLLGEYSTNYLTYDDTPGRVENLDIVSREINDTMLAPGEIFSFNELAEPLDYYETKVIQRGRTDTAEGGGLCQVSSTLYMAVNLAGLEPVERQPHYAELPYIRPGFDATVWFGAIDFKFRNTNDSYVLIKEGIDRQTGDVYSQIWGRPNGREVEMSSEKVAEWEDAEGNPATKWMTYKSIAENGEVIQDGLFHTDTYKFLKPEAAASRPPS